MARIRSVKPEFWGDRKLARCASRDARLLYIALWNLADEHGRLNGDPVWIKGQVFPYDDDLDAAAVGKLLNELGSPELGAVIVYEAGGDPYLFLPKLAKHQRLEAEKVPSRLPAPPARNPAVPVSPNDHEQPGADSSESRADECAPGADESSLLYVAGSREQVAGCIEQGDAAQERGALFAGTESASPPKRGRQPAGDPLFAEWYNAYPLHKARGEAEKAYAKAVRDGADQQALLAAAKRYRDDPQVGRGFAKHPATWLNAKCWLDEETPPPPQPPSGIPGQRHYSEEDYGRAY